MGQTADQTVDQKPKKIVDKNATETINKKPIKTAEETNEILMQVKSLLEYLREGSEDSDFSYVFLVARTVPDDKDSTCLDAIVTGSGESIFDSFVNLFNHNERIKELVEHALHHTDDEDPIISLLSSLSDLSKRR